VGTKADDRISGTIIERCVQHGLRRCKDRAVELQRVGTRLEVGHGLVADSGEIEDEGVAAGVTGQRLVGNACDDGAGRGLIVHVRCQRADPLRRIVDALDGDGLGLRDRRAVLVGNVIGHHDRGVLALHEVLERRIGWIDHSV